jgi:hypothetical protein
MWCNNSTMDVIRSGRKDRYLNTLDKYHVHLQNQYEQLTHERYTHRST